MKLSEFCKYASAALAMKLLMAFVIGTSAAASDELKSYQIHGFASQGYILTDENNFYGDSEDGGSFDYYELGLNAFWQVADTLSASGQLLVRDAGETDDGKLRVDYLFLDKRFINMDAATAGVRVGRVKNPLGFYNESRDVIFTRPSILLPQSIYLEGIGVREILFSSDGVQLYSDWDHGRHHTAFKVNFARTDDVSDQTRRNFFGGTGGSGGGSFPGFSLDQMKISDLFFTQVMDEVDGGRMRFAISYLTAILKADFTSPQLPAPLTVSVDSNIYTLSAQYNAERWSLTSEYSLTTTKFGFGGSESRLRSDGMYLQGEYRMTPVWTGLLRYDMAFSNRNDRANSDARDITAGLSWSPNPSWVVMGEYHYIHGDNGDSSLPNPDNPGGASNRTNLLAVMVGYRF